MPSSRPVRLALLLVAAAAAGAGGVVAIGCSKAPREVAVEGTGGDRVDALERRLREVEQQNSEFRQAASASGLAGATTGQTVSDLMGRIKKLEDQLAAIRANPPAATESSNGSNGVGPASGPSTPTGYFAPQPDGSYTPEQVAAWQKLADAAEKQRNAERLAERVRREIERAKINLTPEQTAAVIKLQASYQDKLSELFRNNGIGADEAEREARQQKMEDLRTQFANDLRGVVPAADADRLSESMRRAFPGLFPRTQFRGANANPPR